MLYLVKANNRCQSNHDCPKTIPAGRACSKQPDCESHHRNFTLFYHENCYNRKLIQHIFEIRETYKANTNYERRCKQSPICCFSTLPGEGKREEHKENQFEKFITYLT